MQHLIHYNCQSILNFYVLSHHLKRQDYNHQEPQIYVQFLIRVVYPINMYLQCIVFSNESAPNYAMNVSID